MMLLCSFVTECIQIYHGVQRELHREKQFACKEGSSGVENIGKVSLKDLEEVKFC